jgi:tetratricopeptide (TPR) repeat protein
VSAPQQTIDIGQTLMRANAHWNAGQADQAELACQQVLAVWPGQSDAMHLLGLMAHAYGNLDLAIAHLRVACQAPRAPAVYSSNLAEMCRQRGLLAEGEQAARRAVAMDPRQAGAWNNLGILVQEQGKFKESRQCLQRVLELEPDNGMAHNNLANTCKHLGLLDQAERHWLRALELVPNYAEAYSNLANLMTDRAEYDKAADCARRAIEINPRLADAYLNYAGVETARQRHQDALRWLQALLEFAPAHGSGLAALALTLKQLDELPRAVEAGRRAVAAAPENPEAHHALGQVLQASGQHQEALAAYEKAVTLPGTAQEKALVSRAVLHMELGRKEPAQAAFDAATAAFPASATAWFNRADMGRFKPGDAAVARMEALLGPGGLQSPTDRMLLHFALGKAYLDLGDSARAFHHFDTGNAMKRPTFGYDSAATGQWLASIAETFSAGLLRAKGGAGAASAMPVFVLGMPRSGTTLIEQILASHPAVHGAGELRHMQRLVDGLGAFPQVVPELAPERLKEMGQAYLARIAPLAQGRRHVVDKMPSNFLYAGLIRLILPDARIIHTRRDPVDTCLSCYSKLFAAEQAFSYDQTELGLFHAGYQKLMAHWRAVLPASHFLEVDYEAVVDDLEAEARRMIDFLGLPWDAACLEFHRTERPVLTASVNQVRQPIYRTSAGRWRAHAAQLQPLLAALGVAAA